MQWSMSASGSGTLRVTGVLLVLPLVTLLAVAAGLMEPGTRHSSFTDTTSTAITSTQACNTSYFKESATKQIRDGGLLQDVEGRKATAFSVLYWPEGDDGLPLIPYIVVDLTPGYRRAAQRGMSYWMLHTCVKFVEVRYPKGSHLRLIRGLACHSAVGRVSNTGQDVVIGPGCRKLRRMVRLLARALGWYDEHNRPDRDVHVHINWENVAPVLAYRLKMVPPLLVHDFGVPYDLTSLMHADPRFLSANGKTTLATTNPLLQGLAGLSSGLSHRDKLLANFMYQCTAKWVRACGLKADICRNGGYTRRDCSCACPSGTAGKKCEDVTGGYYDSLLPACTELVRTQTRITSPGYPHNYGRDSRCVKWIKAPPCHTPVLTFHAFHLYERNTYGDDQPLCYLDYLEIRNESLYSGKVYCGKEIYPGQVFTSSSADLILYFKTQTDYFSGWSASITFTPITNCVSNTSTTAVSTSSTTTTPASTTTVLPPTVPATTVTDTETTVTTTITRTTSTLTPTNSTEATTSTATSTKGTTSITIPATTISTTPSSTTNTILSSTTTPFTPTTHAMTTTTTITTLPSTTPPKTTTPNATTITTTITSSITTNTTNTTITTTVTPLTTSILSTTTKPTTSTTSPTNTTTTSTTAFTSIITAITDPETTTDTSTSISDPNCGLEDKKRRYHWTSPNFPCENYSNNFTCIIRGGSRRPFWAVFRFNVFQLPPGCGDRVSLSLPFSREVKFCGVRTRPYLAPTFNFEASFTSDASITDIGFNITVTPKRSPCHKRVLLRDNDIRRNITSWKTGNMRQLVLCEWWVEAPRGKRLRVERVVTAIARTKGCTLDYLVINGSGQKRYPAASSFIYCGRMNVAAPLTTTGNLLLVTYRGRVPLSKGFVLHYQVLT